MVVKTRVGGVYIEKNKKTGEEFIYDDLGREEVYTYSSNTNRHYEFYCHGLIKIDPDERRHFIQITHKLDDGTEHILRIVADFKHTYKNYPGFHLNLTEDSITVKSKCVECNKYFTQFNHFVIIPEKSEGMNITDGDSIFYPILRRLSQILFPDYRFYKRSNLLFNSKI